MYIWTLYETVFCVLKSAENEYFFVIYLFILDKFVNRTVFFKFKVKIWHDLMRLSHPIYNLVVTRNQQLILLCKLLLFLK